MGELDIAATICEHPCVSDVTQILLRVEAGESAAADELLPLVYQELRRLAAHKMAQEAPGHTLQPTALVHEAWLRMLKPEAQARFQNRSHFMAAAAQAMRRILVESARRKSRIKHGGEWERVNLDAVDVALPLPADEFIALDEALDRLEKVDVRAAQVVKLCFFGGLTRAQASKELGVSVATAERLWSFARAWLFKEVKKATNSTGGAR